MHFKKIASRIGTKVRQCSDGTINNEQFWSEFWNLWAHHESRFQGQSLQFTGKSANWRHAWKGLFNGTSPPLGLPEPPDGIKPLIEGTAASTWRDFAEQVRNKVKDHNGRIIFTLLVSAFEGRLERLGYSTTMTLGQKIDAIHANEKLLTGTAVPDEIVGSIVEIVKRRNDLIHADGVVRQEYLDQQRGRLARSYWIKNQGWPIVSSLHDFGLEYLYYTATILNYYAVESPTA
jgi:hypothetical protein